MKAACVIKGELTYLAMLKRPPQQFVSLHGSKGLLGGYHNCYELAKISLSVHERPGCVASLLSTIAYLAVEQGPCK